MHRAVLAGVLLVLLAGGVVRADEPKKPRALPAPGPADWATYNYDALGSRHNAAEKTLGPTSVGKLQEKWRFPARFSLTIVGAIHATPVVVNGHVYFGTASLPTFYKLGPDGKLKWSYQNPTRRTKVASSAGVPADGFLNSALVTGDTVFVGDAGGFLYALDRATGKERWKIDSRDDKQFPGAHPSNCIFSAPILADGKVVVAGGGFEHAVGANPKHACCTGRGFVAAFEPDTGKVVWKYDVGPEPKKFDTPVTIKDDWGEHVFHCGPSTSSVWSTPSYDPTTGLVTFGTDAHNSPRQPTKDNPRLHTKHSCAVIAVDARTGKERWVTQLNEGDVWNYALRGYDAKTGRYKDQSIGDTPKPYTIDVGGKQTRVVGVGCKNGGFYVLNAATGQVVAHTPTYTGPPEFPLKPALNPRTLALPGLVGGLQTGCATDGKAIYTNGIDHILAGTSADPKNGFRPPTGGRVVSISPDTRTENWRHERPRVKAVGGTTEKPAFTDVGDPVGSGIALANGVAFFTTTVSNQLVALDTASGKVLKEVHLGPVWCGPSVSRGRVYVGTGNLLFAPMNPKEGYFPKAFTGTLYCFGLPGEDEVSRMGKGDEGER